MAEPLRWQIASVEAIRPESSRSKSFSLRLPQWRQHRAGQHYDVRLTAADGYQAERSYSIASEPERQGVIELTVERIEDGEVSPYLHDMLRAGDQIEVRGPIGGYFAWDVSLGGPLLLVAGGSGIVPLMAMIRHRAAQKSTVPTRLLYSSRSPDDLIYGAELGRLSKTGDGLNVAYSFTRSQPAGWSGYRRRIDREMLSEVSRDLAKQVRVFVCGPTLLVEVVADQLLSLSIPSAQIKTERFGPTGN
jgi:ferredoxin-NADP reductase